MNTTQFRKRIRASLINEGLQIALDANTERRLKGRAIAFASLPDWKERRQRAHAVRADVIAHLDEYLEQFIVKAQQNGVTVHRAKDADEAVKIVLEITQDLPHPPTGMIRHTPAPPALQRTPRTLHARSNEGAGTQCGSSGANSARGEHGEEQEKISVHQRSSASPTLIAKSKSMVSEEINLNHALEKEGIRVVETDLGEYIVQLRNERPSHIITPAVHLRRSDVGQLFHEKLGIPYTEDIPTLTDTARRVLREVFLTADIGVSGVNFGIAETGGICLVTNEGNGRMVTTLPRTHIALMGMERLVPTLDDLALMLSLLPRSATGQKLSVYTQILHDPLEGQRRHIVILDNGRSRLRNSPLAESLYCIRCGACLNACPVFRELGGHAYASVYPGPIGSVISAGLFGSEFVPLAQASSLCGACKDACPVDIDLPKLLTRVRAGQSPSPRGRGVRGEGLTPSSKFFMQIYSRVARYPRLFAVSQRLAAVGTYLVSPFSSMFRLPSFTGWGYSKDFPRFAARPFRARFKNIQLQPSHSEERGDEESPHTKNEILRSAQDDTNRVNQFGAELTALGGRVIPTNNPTIDIIEFLRSRGISHIRLEANTLDESLLQECGITITTAPDPAIRVGVTPHVTLNWKETCGVTKAICGLADTGSILIVDGDGGPAESPAPFVANQMQVRGSWRESPLRASLLPGVHIAVLNKSDLLPSLEYAMDLVRESKAAVFITGPSRTADIEMTLTIGVHGPGELHVFLVDD